jgi:hypothetical protein
MENTKENRTALAFVAFGLAFVLFCVWLVFSSTQRGHRAEAAIDHLLPTWLVVVNLVLLPCLVALTAGASRIPISLRFSFGALMRKRQTKCMDEVFAAQAAGVRSAMR